MSAVAVESPAIVSASVELPVKDFIAAVKATGLAAGSDDSLPILTAIKLTVLERGIVLAATDRYRLAESRYGLGDEVATVLVRAKDLITFAKSLKVPARSYVPLTVSLTVEGGKVTVSGLDTSRTFDVLDGTFPPYEHLYPTDSNAVSEIRFNPGYLSDGMTACQLMSGDKSVPARFMLVATDKPALIVPDSIIDGWAFRYALMPMRQKL